MARIAIVTDSTSDIPHDLAAGMGITVVPCQVHLEKRTFWDGVDLTHQELAYLLRHGPPFPTTAPPPVGVFMETYRRLAQESSHIISVHLASSLSVLYNVAKLAAEMVPEANINLVDSRQVSMGTGWLVLAAARAAREGATPAAIMDMVRDMIPRLRLYAYIDDIQYLRRSGRVGWASALLGAMFKIKPLIGVQGGRVELVEKCRTAARALERLIELVAAHGPLQEIAVLHLAAQDIAAEVADRLSGLLPGHPILITEAGSTIGTHAGPGAVGVAFVLADKPGVSPHSRVLTR